MLQDPFRSTPVPTRGSYFVVYRHIILMLWHCWLGNWKDIPSEKPRAGIPVVVIWFNWSFAHLKISGCQYCNLRNLLLQLKSTMVWHFDSSISKLSWKVAVKTRVPTLLLTKKSRTFPGLSRTPWKIFQDLFGARECLNIKRKQHLLTIFRV